MALERSTNNSKEGRMKISVAEDRNIELREVNNGITLISNDDEHFTIVMRDSGFEFLYQGQWWEAKECKVKLIKQEG